MNNTVPAIYEDGVLKPLEELELADGEKVEVILVKRQVRSKSSSREILSEIAELPIESSDVIFSARNHDDILYPQN